jgi:hypothetical protein
MTDLFELKTGKFVPLDNDQLATLTEPQAAAYIELRDAVGALADADREVEDARLYNGACVEALAVSEKNAPPRRTFLQEWRAMTGKA